MTALIILGIIIIIMIATSRRKKESQPDDSYPDMEISDDRDSKVEKPQMTSNLLGNNPVQRKSFFNSDNICEDSIDVESSNWNSGEDGYANSGNENQLVDKTIVKLSNNQIETIKNDDSIIEIPNAYESLKPNEFETEEGRSSIASKDPSTLLSDGRNNLDEIVEENAILANVFVEGVGNINNDSPTTTSKPEFEIDLNSIDEKLHGDSVFPNSLIDKKSQDHGSDEEESNVIKSLDIIKIENGNIVQPKIQEEGLISEQMEVTEWDTRYIYSYSELNNASFDQKQFYEIFKKSFLRGDYIELGDNSNYSFILLFDIMEMYKMHKDLSKLEVQLKNLGDYYPVTERHSIAFLKNALLGERIGDVGSEFGETQVVPKSYNGINKSGGDPPDTQLEKTEDRSIIDITGDSYKIPPKKEIYIISTEVPEWDHHYVNAYSEIYAATIEQQKFYTIFRDHFLKKEYIDLKGNSNYAFILLFDFLGEYDKDYDISILESRLKLLGNYYPITERYCIAFYKNRLSGSNDRKVELDSLDRFRYPNYNNFYEIPNLGNRFKDKLDLTVHETGILSRVNYYGNNFCDIEFCCQEIVKLFLLLIKALQVEYESLSSTLDAELLIIADLRARKQFKYKNGSHNYRYSIEDSKSQIYSNIFKHCENALRAYYGHKRKINSEISFTPIEVQNEYDARIVAKVTALLDSLVFKSAPPDENTEIELYTQNTNRWQIKFDSILKEYDKAPKDFVTSIVKLATLNINNPSIENIYYEASKFVAKFDKQSAIWLYIQYIYYDLNSVKFNNRQLTKTIQKNLFSTNDQLHSFQKIVSELMQDKNLKKALTAVSNFYVAKRKKIELDSALIKEAVLKDSETIELLNEYLKDDYEDHNTSIKSQEINSEEIRMEITQKNPEIEASTYIDGLKFTTIQNDALTLFAKESLSVLQTDFDIFAKSKKVFKNQLIESINETCYETLDDLLIEEEDNLYTINPEYYKKISI